MNKEWKNESSMVKLKGQNTSFRCHCGCNVFKNSQCERYYKCNSCGDVYDTKDQENTNVDKIKPCHRCGETAHYDEDWGMILCGGCGYYLQQDSMKLEQLIKFWNTRNIEDELERQLNEFKKENAELLIKLKAHKKQSLTVAENIKFRELKEKGDE